MIKADYTRKELMELCERAIVPEGCWSNRDTPHCQKKIGMCWALLKAGCDFSIVTVGTPATDERTIWIDVVHKSFDSFELGPDAALEEESFYIPTPKTLDEANGEDWY